MFFSEVFKETDNEILESTFFAGVVLIIYCWSAFEYGLNIVEKIFCFVSLFAFTFFCEKSLYSHVEYCFFFLCVFDAAAWTKFA